MLEDSLSDGENNLSNQDLETLPDNQAELLAEFERRRRVTNLTLTYLFIIPVLFLDFIKQARTIHVSTDDTEVKINLRQLNEPICNCFNWSVYVS